MGSCLISKILIVEDEFAISQVLKAYIVKENFEAVQCFIGTEALQLFKEHEPDLVLLDVMLPGKDGWTILKELRAISQCPVIRLEQLEKTRTELLAGVTHELKTHVTSISGLLQAVNDEVVTGEDAKEFIKMALAESTKMKTMIGDLLAFNSFAVDAVPVKIETVQINDVVGDIVRSWGTTYSQIDLHISLLEKNVNMQADAVRVQQILSNLLTNAEQAMDGNGTIHVTLQTDNHFIIVDVQDSGLGLALSKMMAQSIGGDLMLVNSTPQGTTFRLKLVKTF